MNTRLLNVASYKGGKEVEIRRGDVFYADLGPGIGSEQKGIRPVVVIQNDVGNHFSPTIICAAITSKMNKSKLPTHVHLEFIDSLALLEQVRTIDKHRLREKIGTIDKDTMQGINKALKKSLSLT